MKDISLHLKNSKLKCRRLFFGSWLENTRLAFEKKANRWFWWIQQRIVQYFPYVPRRTALWVSIASKVALIAAIIGISIAFLSSLCSVLMLKTLANLIGMGLIFHLLWRPMSNNLSDFIFKIVLQNLQTRVDTATWRKMNVNESSNLGKYCRSDSFSNAIEDALRWGKQGLLVGKKDEEKTNINADSNSPCNRITNKNLPRKILISFHHRDNLGKKEVKKTSWLYCGLDLCLSVFVKTKGPGGRKMSSSETQTTKGAYKICHYTEYVRALESEIKAKNSPSTEGVALRIKAKNEDKFGMFHQYSIQKSAGEALSRAKSRLNKVKLKDSQVFSIFEQVTQQLEGLHKKGFFHGDIKPDNIVVCRDFEVYTVIDFPGLYPHSKKTTPSYSLLTLEHNELRDRDKKLIKESGLDRLKKITIDCPRAIFHDTWATLYILKTLVFYVETPQVYGRAVACTMEQMMQTLGKLLMNANDHRADTLIHIMNTKWNMNAALKALRANFEEAQKAFQDSQQERYEREGKKLKDSIIIDMFFQIKDQLQPLHKSGNWYGNIEDENISVMGQYTRFQLFPSVDSRNIPQKNKQESLIVSSLRKGVFYKWQDSEKNLAEAITIVLSKLGSTEWAYTHAIFYDTWATLCVIKNVSDKVLHDRTYAQKSVVKTMAKMILSLGQRLKESKSKDDVIEYMNETWSMEKAYNVLYNNFKAIKDTVDHLNDGCDGTEDASVIRKGLGPPLRTYASWGP